MKYTLTPLIALIAISACTPNLGAENTLIDLGQIETDRSGKCFGKDVSPAVFEIVTTTTIVRPAEIDDEGNIIVAAITKDVSEPTVIREREELRFETICPPDYTPEFVATLQRALTVRGFYKGPINGHLDVLTSTAIRHFQRSNGHDTPLLALETARVLGVVELDRATLQ